MDRNKDIANRVREVLLNGRWIAYTNYQDQITQVNWQQAIQKVSSLNTIALLTFHINYYLTGILSVFEGGPLDIKDKYSFDMPPVTSEQDWQDLIKTFLTNAEKFVSHVENLPEGKLDEAFVDEKYGTYLRNIEGVIEHSYYHLGQMAIIRKMILGN